MRIRRDGGLSFRFVIFKEILTGPDDLSVAHNFYVFWNPEQIYHKAIAWIPSHNDISLMLI